jgi:hypothetical protein
MLARSADHARRLAYTVLRYTMALPAAPHCISDVLFRLELFAADEITQRRLLLLLASMPSRLLVLPYACFLLGVSYLFLPSCASCSP